MPESKPQEQHRIQTQSLRETISRVLQRSSKGISAVGSDFESQLSSAKGGGSPLPDSVQSFMGPRMGADLSGVRVHTDSASVQMNQEIGAQAFTHGNHMFYGEGKGPANDHLTAHELTHTLQQGEGKPLSREQIQRQLADYIDPIQHFHQTIQRQTTAPLDPDQQTQEQGSPQNQLQSTISFASGLRLGLQASAATAPGSHSDPIPWN